MTAALLGVAFIAFSIWWILVDRRIPGGGDPGRHLLEAIDLGGRIRGGDLLAPLTFESAPFAYPPLVRTVGAVPELLGLPTHDWSPILLNLIFVPLLTAGCYLTGKLVFGRLAGVLAALFALGSPMVLQLFHVYLIDAPLAAIVAFTTWAVLASDNFTRRRETLLAGALVGVALLIKTPAPVFVAGPIVVMLARGGWRQGRNLALATLAAIVVAGPYYLIHINEFVHVFGEATVSSSDPWTKRFGSNFDGLSRFGSESLAWYWWAAVNTQYLLPLLTLFAIGFVHCLTNLRRRYVPEILAGVVCGYLAMTFLSIHDARYTLPLVVYVAVIGTGWISQTRRRWAAALGSAALVTAVVINVAVGNLGAFRTVQLHLPGDDPAQLTHPGALTLFDKRGYVVGEPRTNPLWTDLFDAARDTGVRRVALSIRETPNWGTDTAGFEVMAHDYGIASPYSDAEATEEPDLVITIWWTSDTFFVEQAGLAPPCAHIEDGVANFDNATIPPYEGVPLSVLVERRSGSSYERWCDF